MHCRFDDHVTGRAFVCEDLRGELVASSTADVPAVVAAAEAAAHDGLVAAGFVAYDAAPAFEPALRVPAGRRAVALPSAWFGVFARRRVVPLVNRPWPAEGIHRWRWCTDEADHARSLASIRGRIAAGWTYQVNHTVRLVADGVAAPRLLYAHLSHRQQGAYHAYLETPDWAVACASPELFFDATDGVVTTKPMKGTAGRSAGDDDAAAAALVASAKERAENVMIVDLLRNDLGRVAPPGGVEVAGLCQVERYPTVWQLTSTVRARTRPGIALVDVFGALFPCGSVTGAPKVATMAAIAEEEDAPRGVYCGAVGVVEPGRARFAVAIRTAVVDRRTARAEVGVGSGVTWSSSAEGEWAELQAKARILDSDPSQPELLETLAFDAGEGLRHLEAHLDRLADAAARLGIDVDRAVVAERARAAVADRGTTARVRLRVAPDGAVAAEAEPLPAPPTPVTRLALDDEPVDPDDPWLRVKTTARAPYDRRAARHPDADDVVLVNARGEVTETTRATLAVLTERGWVTPPLSAGCLPGVERARLVALGVLRESTVTVDALRRASAVAVVSSLRGWTPAEVVSG